MTTLGNQLVSISSANRPVSLLTSSSLRAVAPSRLTSSAITSSTSLPSTAATALLRIRLFGGSNPGSGRLEILQNGTWGAVCRKNWNDQAANVVCRQLYGTAANLTVPQPNISQSPSSLTWSNVVNCSGTETTLAECIGGRPWLPIACTETDQVRLACQVDSLADSITRLRLTGGGSNASRGRLEVFYNGTWGVVCSHGFDAIDAAIACRQLGYGSGSLVVSSLLSRWISGLSAPTVNQSVPVWMTDISCNGSESTLFECPHRGFNMTQGCLRSSAVIIQCQPLTATTQTSTTLPLPSSTAVTARPSAVPWELRLQPVNGVTRYGHGLLQVHYGGEWGGVCITDSAVVYNPTAELACRQLNFSTGYALENNRLVVGDYVLKDVRCTGSEATLSSCRRAPDIDADICIGEEQLHIQCMDSLEQRTRNIRLAYGISNRTGVVQRLVNGTWRTICSKNSWSLGEASVVCRQLGFRDTQHASTFAIFNGTATGVLINDYIIEPIMCQGDEPRLSDCGVPIMSASRNSSCGRTALHAAQVSCF